MSDFPPGATEADVNCGYLVPREEGRDLPSRTLRVGRKPGTEPAGLLYAHKSARCRDREWSNDEKGWGDRANENKKKRKRKAVPLFAIHINTDAPHLRLLGMRIRHPFPFFFALTTRSGLLGRRETQRILLDEFPAGDGDVRRTAGGLGHFTGCVRRGGSRCGVCDLGCLREEVNGERGRDQFWRWGEEK